MEMNEIIAQAEQNIRQAIADYRRHTHMTDVLDDVSNKFIERLAKDSSYAKQNLRELFSKSPVWDEKIDALVINGTRTHNPDYSRIRELANDILWHPMQYDNKDKYELFVRAINFFAYPPDADKTDAIEAIKELAPKAYAPGKKPSRIFRALCQEYGVVDESPGSEFQRLYAQFADELTSKKISFKLYVSINPAHFITMSNPKGDERGETMTSCHSFNYTEYSYNNGCSGYARDEVTFIVFTVSDPSDPETLNNRKTTRQIFAYKPGNGLLMQSRLYNTSGGTSGAQEESKLYRDLVQREISMLENAPNLWKTYSYLNEHQNCVYEGTGFGGYADWMYESFEGKVSIRNDHAEDYEPLEVGTYGLCICCGTEIDAKLYCYDCEDEGYVCDRCDSRCNETFTVHNDNGRVEHVCEDCLHERYTQCDRCNEYHPDGCIEYVDGYSYCPHCLEEYCEQCEECGEWHKRDNMYLVHDECGDEVWVCSDCLSPYNTCEDCGEAYHNNSIWIVHSADGSERYVCEDCGGSNYTECPHCGEHVEIKCDGTCLLCGENMEKEDEAV